MNRSPSSDLTTARDAALQLATQRPTAKNRKALKVAQKALDAVGSTAPIADSYASILDLVAALDADGWKGSKSSAYDHWKKDGKLHARADGRFDKHEAERYARANLARKDGAVVGTDYAEEKRKEEILRIRSDRQMRELKYQQELGELTPRSQMEIELAERATYLRDYLDAVSRSAVGKIIKLVKGDPQHGPELVKFLLGMNRKAMDNYARPIAGVEEEEE